MLDGRNSADLTNMIGAGNPNRAALPFIKPEVKSITAIFPEEAIARKLEQLKDMTPQQRRAMNRIWTEIKAKGG
jgi:spermidine/putrescine transport system substrate-binding protein